MIVREAPKPVSHTSALQSHVQNTLQKTLPLNIPASPSQSLFNQLAEAFVFPFTVSIIVSSDRHKGELLHWTRNKPSPLACKFCFNSLTPSASVLQR